MAKIATLSIVEDIKNHKFLMVKNHRGINKGYINFSGGKQEKGETLEECVVRETFEETGITIANPKNVGHIVFYNHIPEGLVIFEVYVFWSTEFSGNLQSNDEEVEAFWIEKANIPFDKMRSADQNFLRDIFVK